MMTDRDSRVVVRFGTVDQAGAETALLIEGDPPAPLGCPMARFVLGAGLAGHAPGCACCVPRGPVADALGRLFLDRARGGAWFREVVAVVRGPAAEAAVRAAVTGDVVVRARFRLG